MHYFEKLAYLEEIGEHLKTAAKEMTYTVTTPDLGPIRTKKDREKYEKLFREMDWNVKGMSPKQAKQFKKKMLSSKWSYKG